PPAPAAAPSGRPDCGRGHRKGRDRVASCWPTTRRPPQVRTTAWKVAMTERPDQPDAQPTPESAPWPPTGAAGAPAAAADPDGPQSGPDLRRKIVTAFSVLVVLVGVGVGIAAWAGAFSSDDSAGSGGSVVTAADGTDEQQIQS